ncbi:protein ACCELERATED CELL DEATH 6-like [Macadamia integrifolia]|uniref:protein ACCELERATED CELL DEATH 6-like n=1 Tax=Macadamia integrifolia TaxID=60698 RepID=UPI001C52F97A|nr:protein ACCELERATED CELL DEATH 6-like [Macadamia integrifolia]
MASTTPQLPPFPLMNPLLHKAILAGDEHTVSLFEHDFLTLVVSRQGNTVAHIAARLGHHSIFELLSNRCPSILYKPNPNGDTPLHIAARASQIGIVKFLLAYCTSRHVQTGDGDVDGNGGALKQQYLRMQNEKGNTALHEALENNHEEVARLLFTAHSELSYLGNNEGKYPAYLAAEAGFLQLLKDMLELLGDIENPGQWSGGKTPLHVAIIKGHPETLELVLKVKPQLSRLTDKNGRNPLHYAASIGYYDGLIALLNIDTLPAYEADHTGLYPIHMAASTGHIKVIQLLLEHCPGSWELLNQKSQNILHIAAQSGKKNVVTYILNTPVLEKLINERDDNGNTPLHLATKGWRSKVVGVLSRDQRVKVNILNNINYTALDIAETKDIGTVASFRKLLTLTALRIANAPRARDVYDDEVRLNSGVRQPTVEFYKDKVNTLLLVSTLVATVTFTAGFTIPGGLNSDDPDQGMATMLSNNKFKAFVICDTISMYCSILSVLSLVWAQIGDVPLMRSIIDFTLPLLGISLSMMAVAFTVGLYIVTSRLHWLANVVLVMSILFLICILALSLPLRMPIWSQNRFFQRISYYFLYLLVSAAGGDSDSVDDITTREVANLFTRSRIPGIND